MLKYFYTIYTKSEKCLVIIYLAHLENIPAFIALDQNSAALVDLSMGLRAVLFRQ
jgi:hypothetical protein